MRCAGAIRPPPSVDRISTSVFGRLQVAAEFSGESMEHQAEEAAAAQVCRAIEPDAARSVREHLPMRGEPDPSPLVTRDQVAKTSDVH